MAYALFHLCTPIYKLKKGILSVLTEEAEKRNKKDWAYSFFNNNVYCENSGPKQFCLQDSDNLFDYVQFHKKGIALTKFKSARPNSNRTLTCLNTICISFIRKLEQAIDRRTDIQDETNDP